MNDIEYSQRMPKIVSCFFAFFVFQQMPVYSKIFSTSFFGAVEDGPEPKSVLVMDNASFHHFERITQMRADAGVKLIYLPPYSPDLNSIEEFFAELKSFTRRSWCYYEENPGQGFNHFLDWCIEAVGAKGESAEGHFRHTGLAIEYLECHQD